MKTNIQNESKIYFQSDIIGDYYCVSKFGEPEISTVHSLSYNWSNSVFIGIPPEIKVEDNRANKFHCRQNVTFSNGIDSIRFTIHRHDSNTGKTQVLDKGDFDLVTGNKEQGFQTQTFSKRLFSSNSEVCIRQVKNVIYQLYSELVERLGQRINFFSRACLQTFDFQA